MKFFKNEIIKAVVDFKSSKDVLITYESMVKIPLGVTIQYEKIKGLVESTKIARSEKSMSFRVEMKKGQKWRIHHHDCEEVILVFKGSLKGMKSNKIGNINTPVRYDPFFSHEVVAEEDSIFYVEFKNPKLNKNNELIRSIN